MSKSIYSIPDSVEAYVGECFVTQQIAMSHPLCNIQQSIDWLIKPVGTLISRIQSSTSVNQNIDLPNFIVSVDTFLIVSNTI